MSDLYFIAHKVRGEPAFDVATRMECPECHNGLRWEANDSPECIECDGLGFWWIIPTSGHRAYPWWSRRLGEAEALLDNGPFDWDVPPMPLDLPDHYAHSATPQPALDISALVRTKPITIRRS